MSEQVPNARQVMGAKIRHLAEKWNKKHRKEVPGGWVLPLDSRQKREKWISKKTGVPVENIRYYTTYSRNCTHPWSDGACIDCPDTGPWPQDEE